MNPPEGRLLRSRVVADPGVALASALDRSLTGYALLEPRDALLLDADDAGVIAFREGVPVGAHHLGTGRSGPAALADLAVPGPYRLELRALADLAALPVDDWGIPPAMPAERLAGDADLAARTRSAAPRSASRRTGGSNAAGAATGDDPRPERDGVRSRSDDPRGENDRERATGETDRAVDDRPAEASGGDAVAAFLDDEAKIDALREQARAEARDRAAEWGLDDQLTDDP